MSFMRTACRHPIWPRRNAVAQLGIIATLLIESSVCGQPIIEFTKHPQNLFISQGQIGLFTVKAQAFEENLPVPVHYQWQELNTSFDWVNVIGATNDTWVHPPIYNCIASPLLYRCAAFVGDAVVFSAVAELVVLSECYPTTVVSVDGSVERQEVIVTFDVAIDTTSATDIFNYQLMEWPGMTPIEIWYATMLDIRTVALHLDGASVLRRDTPYVLKASGISNLSDPACGCPPLIPVEWRFIINSETCAQIIRQPVSSSASLGCRAIFEVQAEWLDGIEHQPLRYQWFRDGIPIWQATQRTHTTAPLLPRNTNDSYYVEIYGACETLRSLTVSPVVQTNVETLQLHSVRLGQARHSVVVSFVPACDGAIVPLREESAALQNFQWSSGLASHSAYLDCTGTNIIVFTTPQQPGSNYSVTISNISDQGGHLLENGTAAGNFLAPAPPPLPATGHLQPTTAGQLLVLEWTGGGTLQTTYKADGPWQDLPFAVSPLVLFHWFSSCDGPHPPFGTYYRVRWPAPH